MTWVAFRCSNSKIVIIAYVILSLFPIVLHSFSLFLSATWCSTAWVSCCSNSKIAIIAYVLQCSFSGGVLLSGISCIGYPIGNIFSGTDNVQAAQKFITGLDATRLSKFPEYRDARQLLETKEAVERSRKSLKKRQSGKTYFL
ncbi:hypothetical protein NC653_038235 [Populus alba x Populus x berolinensis]|uniref:Uncharacterized protein n=1 Tax=Populus alba x Populus x berolinensis TaxID=444605 RepID=A0AAD6PT42_9ROSI|nr:hypothetical protein NC653_038235 [Populus alba x Populus x berolinensis]